jgi:NAD(P)-dependent dehydrogenase (short-subunit alcohol dehydrogenase family)
VRLRDKVAIVVGAGQTLGETIGNGRATAITFAREGAKVVLVDRRADSAKDTQAMLEGGESVFNEADVTNPEDCAAIVKAAIDAFGRVDVLHNNVGIGAGDGNIASVSDEAWQRIIDVNLTGMFNTCKAALPMMRDQGSGAILNISSIASICSVPLLAYKVSKAGVNALTQQLALANAKYGVRVNAILPGLMDTPMAVDAMARATGTDRADYAAFRDAQVPLLGKQGTAWDVANAALFLASDEARFITGVLLPVDGGQSAKVG